MSVQCAYAQGDRAALCSSSSGNALYYHGVSVILPFIRVDYDGEEAIGPKWLVPCSPPVLADGYEFDHILNVRAGAAAVEATAAAPDAAPDANM